MVQQEVCYQTRRKSASRVESVEVGSVARKARKLEGLPENDVRQNVANELCLCLQAQETAKGVAEAAKSKKTHGYLPLFLAQFLVLALYAGAITVAFFLPKSQSEKIERVSTGFCWQKSGVETSAQACFLSRSRWLQLVVVLGYFRETIYSCRAKL